MFSLDKSIIPSPKQITNRNKSISIATFSQISPKVIYDSSDVMINEGVKLIKAKIADYIPMEKENENSYVIKLKVEENNPKFKDYSDEAYYIDVDETEATLCGKSSAGVFYASTTFCQMLYEEGEDILITKSYIFDYPDFKYRGQFFECRYGSEFMTKENWFELIDTLAQMKSNRLTIGVYGCWSVQYDERKMEYLYVPIKKYPQLKTIKNIKYYSVKDKKIIYKENLLPTMFEEDFLGELMAYGKKKNVIVRPLFNSLGHNTLLPEKFPEISAVGENGEKSGFGFCTKTDKTYEVMFDIYDEIIDNYLIPNDIYEIEIGLDEVGKGYICHCDKCKDFTHAELMVEYIIKLCKYIKSKGMKRIYIYHDMLYHEFNIVNEDLKERFIKEGIYDEVVLNWWTYEDPKHLFWDKKEGVNNIFHSVIKPDTGYYHWTVPTENNENIRACVKMAKELSFEGVESYSSWEHCYDKNYLTLADVSWNADNVEDFKGFDERYAIRNFPKNVSKAMDALRAMSDIMKDETGELYMNRLCYKFDYYFYSYKKSNKPYPQNFPGDAFKLISENENEYISYFDYIIQKSKTALDFFEGNKENSRINDIWTLTAKQYYTTADEYLTLYGLGKSYNSGEADSYKVVCELERLLSQREELMLMAEKVRIKATSYTYLRNMSVVRQYIKDLLYYFKKEISNGNKPKLDLTDLRYVTREKLRFLQ